MSISYRPDIDGLRGLAVISVVLFHLSSTYLPGGFVGVDVFFVISGFLITSIIANNLASQSFSFVDFYARRIRRIFPALLLVLAATLVFGGGMLMRHEFASLSKHAAVSSIFGNNFLLWLETGYWDTGAAKKPLTHLWSLGVEEQFYLAWPLLLWLLWGRRLVLQAVLAALAAGSLWFNLKYAGPEPTRAFYLPFGRLWELLAGAALAFGVHRGWRLRWPAGFDRPLLWNGLALAATAALAWSFIHTRPGPGFPGYQALMPVVATTVLIAIGPRAPLVWRALSFRPLVWVGLISYPLYLWHWPLLSFSHILEGDTPTRRAILALASVALAWATYALVERPIRLRKAFNTAKTAALAGLLAGVGLVGCLGHARILAPHPDAAIIAYLEDIVWTYKDAPSLKSVAISGTEFAGADKLKKDLDHFQEGDLMFLRRIQGSPALPTTLYFGDSHMEHFWPRIDQLVKDQPQKARSAIFFTASCFLPIPGVEVPPEERPHFVGLAQAMVNLALHDKNIDTVVISSNWGAHLVDARSYRPTDESLYFMTYEGRRENLKAGRHANVLALQALEDSLRKLRAAGKRVFLVLTVPGGGAVAIKRTWGHFELAAATRNGHEFLRENDSLRLALKQVAERAGAQWIDPYLTMCPGDQCASLYEGQHPVYMDGAHVADRYVRRFATFLDATLIVP